MKIFVAIGVLITCAIAFIIGKMFPGKAKLISMILMIGGVTSLLCGVIFFYSWLSDKTQDATFIAAAILVLLGFPSGIVGLKMYQTHQND